MSLRAVKTLLVVYHSATGGTRQMTEAACAAAQAAEPTVAVRLLHAAEAGVADVLAADGYVFATPENLAAISGQLKDFLTAATTARSTRSMAAPTPCWSVRAATGRTPCGRWRASPRVGA